MRPIALLDCSEKTKSLSAAEIQTTEHLAYHLVTTVTELSLLLFKPDTKYYLTRQTLYVQSNVMCFCVTIVAMGKQ
jgi:hypothetical protein